MADCATAYAARETDHMWQPQFSDDTSAEGKPGLRATRSRFSHEEAPAHACTGARSSGIDAFKMLLRPLGQQMKAYHSVMPASCDTAATRRIKKPASTRPVITGIDSRNFSQRKSPGSGRTGALGLLEDGTYC